LKKLLGFKKPLKSILCRETQRKLYDRFLNMLDGENYQVFIDAGGAMAMEDAWRLCGIARRLQLKRF